MNFVLAAKKLTEINQNHLLDHWKELTADEQAKLLDQIDKIDSHIFREQQQLLREPLIKKETVDPFINFAHSGNQNDAISGKKLIAEGLVGCLLIAGGQGTRLRFNGPKGLFPITPVMHKPLFQWFAEKVVAASKQSGKALPLAVMTSPLNHAATVSYFEENHYFGLQSDQIDFFSQEMLPLLDEKGNLFLESNETLAEGPSGNGTSLKSFVMKGIWEKWNRQGVRYLNYVLIDNVLADPFDAELIGFHQRNKSEITLKCTPRQDPIEKVGVVVCKKGKVHVVEYSEFPESEREARNPDDSLRHQCANLSLFCFNMDFIFSSTTKLLPLHNAFKANAWKFETFIFDLLPYARDVSALLYPRSACFAPLKNYSGSDSPEMVQLALLEEMRRIAIKVTGVKPPERPFELSADFYYPTEEFLKYWQGRSLSSEHMYQGNKVVFT